MMLALRPDLVRRDHIKNDPPKDDASLRRALRPRHNETAHRPRAVGYPELASAEKGRTVLNAASSARPK